MAEKSNLKPELIAFSQYKLGGVQSFYYNLLTHDLNDIFDKQWILTRSTSDTDALPPQPFDFPKEHLIHYDESHGSWRTSYKIQKLLSARKGVILTNHPVELTTLSYYPQSNKCIVHISHDLLYLNWAKEYSNIIDIFIAHNLQIYEDLKKMMHDRVNDIFFLPFGINLSPIKRKKNLDRILNIAFIARLHQLKGIYDIPKINDILKKNNINVHWTIIGDGPEKESFQKLIVGKENYTMYTLPDTTAIFDLIKNCDLFLLPSSLDGTPVALLESMSVGLVPIIYEFNQGIKNVVTPDVGFVVPVGDVEEVAKIIIDLNTDRDHLEILSTAAVEKTTLEYDVKKRAKEYYQLFEKNINNQRNKKKPSIYKNKLDNPMIPIALAKILRKTSKFFVRKNHTKLY